MQVFFLVNVSAPLINYLFSTYAHRLIQYAYFYNVTEANRRYWKALLVSQIFPFLWAELHHIGTERCDLLQEFEKNFRIQKSPHKTYSFIRAIRAIKYLVFSKMLLGSV